MKRADTSVLSTRGKVAAMGTGLFLGLLIIGALISCDKIAEPYKDAERGASNTGAADTVTFPDGFSNVATKCDHGNRIYVAFKGDSNRAAIAVVANDPTCSGAK